MLMCPSLNLALGPKRQQAQLEWAFSSILFLHHHCSLRCRQRFVYVYCGANGYYGSNSSDGAMSLCFFQYSLYGFNLSLKCTYTVKKAVELLGVPSRNTFLM
jgi:hypothetical protein